VTEDCLSCRLSEQPDAPVRERILVRDGWRVAHNFDTSLPGWLVALPLRHVTRLSELEASEAGALGPLLHDVSAALEQVVGCGKTYVMLFAEQPGFAHVHFHVVPRMPDFAEGDLGPRVMRFLGTSAGERVRDEEMDRLALSLRHALEPR
jgi:diadenosine tetraphosphate (Ap4A) HIT family hydrolase